MKCSLLSLFLIVASSGYCQTTSNWHRQLQTNQSDTARLRLYSEIGYRYYWYDQFDSLTALVNEALPQAERVKSARYLGRFYYLQAMILREHKERKESLALLRRSLPLAQQANDKVWVGRIKYKLGVIYADMGDNTHAISESMSNLTYGAQTGDSTLIANTYTLLVVIYERLENWQLMRDYEQKMRAFTKNSELNKSFWFDQRGNHKEALRYRKKFLADVLKYETRGPKIGYALFLVAITLRKQGRLTEASQYLTNALRECTAGNDLIMMGWILEEQSLVDLQKGQFKAAQQSAQKAVQVARKDNVPDRLMHCLANLATVQEASGRYQQALLTYKDYQELKDTLLTVEKVKKIAQLQTQYEVAKKENAIQLLTKNAQIQRLKAAKQNQQLVLAGQRQAVAMAGLITLITLVGVIGYSLYQARITQHQLSQQNQEIETQAYELQEVIQLKNRLFSIVGHDLRSPVASLKARLELAKQSFSGAEGSALSQLEQDINSLQHTLDNILYWSLNQQNGLMVSLRPVDLSELVTSVVAGFAGLIQAKRLVMGFQPEPLWVQTDENLTLLVLRNLLHNAIKFSPVGGHIYLTARQGGPLICLMITDEGMGMDLTKNNPSRPQAGRGTGLGLALSEELMSGVGGQLILDSQPGRGTTITLSWLAAQPELAAKRTFENYSPI